MRSRILAIVVTLLAALTLFAGDEKKCNVSAKACEQQIRQMLTGRRHLGVYVQELNPGLAVKSVAPDGPAHRAGLRPGDRIIAVDGRWTTHASVREFKQIIAGFREGGRVPIVVQRGSAYRRIEIRLEPYTREQIDKIVAAHVAQSHGDPAGSQQP